MPSAVSVEVCRPWCAASTEATAVFDVSAGRFTWANVGTDATASAHAARTCEVSFMEFLLPGEMEKPPRWRIDRYDARVRQKVPFGDMSAPANSGFSS